MKKELDLTDQAVLGMIVRQFTDIENDLRNIGTHIDKLVESTDKENSIENVSAVRLNLMTMALTLKEFTDIVDDYLDISEKTKKENSNNECV